ncbi:MAG TPA: 50S ribosomal protein L23 [Acholeplasmatales bacterium]|nr:50S ribosomal protein L23 [Acholeplasmatales bacterium]
MNGNSKNPYEVIKRPLITEKSTKLIELGKYTFEVMQGVNKVEIAKAVEQAFKVNVVKVNVINVRKKERRVGKYAGLRPAVRKAIVTLQKGQTLDVFEV